MGGSILGVPNFGKLSYRKEVEGLGFRSLGSRIFRV